MDYYQNSITNGFYHEMVKT